MTVSEITSDLIMDNEDRYTEFFIENALLSDIPPVLDALQVNVDDVGGAVQTRSNVDFLMVRHAESFAMDLSAHFPDRLVAGWSRGEEGNASYRMYKNGKPISPREYDIRTSLQDSDKAGRYHVDVKVRDKRDESYQHVLSIQYNDISMENVLNVIRSQYNTHNYMPLQEKLFIETPEGYLGTQLFGGGKFTNPSVLVSLTDSDCQNQDLLDALVTCVEYDKDESRIKTDVYDLYKGNPSHTYGHRLDDKEDMER